VIAQYNASQLLTQREMVSREIRRILTDRCLSFDIILDDVAITHLTFGKEYTAAVEAKQVAQQEAERAKFFVTKAQQEKERSIVQAQGEAQSAKLIGEAIQQNPAFLTLRRIEAAREVRGTSAHRAHVGPDSRPPAPTRAPSREPPNPTRPRPSCPLQIARTVSQAQNRVYLSADSLLLNVGGDLASTQGRR